MKKKFDISAGAIFVLSALYFFGGLKSVAVVIAAAAGHELGHILTIIIFGGKIRAMEFSASGLCISYYGVNGKAKELLSILMGPIFGVALAYAAAYFGKALEYKPLLELAGVSIILSVFNLLPALPLDGGRALYSIIPSKAKADDVLDISGMATGLVLVLLGLYFLGNEKGTALLISGVWVLIAQTGIVKNIRML